MKHIIRISIQVLIGALFISSGFLKALDSQSFIVLTGLYGFGEFLSHLAPLMSAIEIILGLCFILDIKPKLTSLAIGLLTIFFTIAFGYAFYFKGIEDCGCMGSLLKINPYISLGRNILIIAGCFWLWRYGIDEETKVGEWKKWIVYVLGGLAFSLCGYTVGVKLVDNKFKVGDQVSTTTLRYYNERISTGKSIVFIFSPDCSHCWNMTENVKSIKRIPEYSNVIGITYNDADTSRYMSEMQPNFDVFKYPTNELYDLVVEAPLLLVLENGKITRSFRVSHIPCGRILQKIERGEGL